LLRSSLQIANEIIILPVYPSMHFFHWQQSHITDNDHIYPSLFFSQSMHFFHWQWSHIPLSILQSTGFRVSLLSCLKCKAGSGVGTHKRMLTNSPTFITMRIIPQMFSLKWRPVASLDFSTWISIRCVQAGVQDSTQTTLRPDNHSQSSWNWSQKKSNKF
jgi:hypothetical protein